MKITAVAQRSGGWWAIRVPEVDGVFTQARRLDQVEGMARDAIGLMLDIDPVTIEVVLDIRTDKDALVSAAKQAREAADEAADEAARATRRAARELVSEGMTVRDVGRVIGLSHQRVSQLVSS